MCCHDFRLVRANSTAIVRGGDLKGDPSGFNVKGNEGRHIDNLNRKLSLACVGQDLELNHEIVLASLAQVIVDSLCLRNCLDCFNSADVLPKINKNRLV